MATKYLRMALIVLLPFSLLLAGCPRTCVEAVYSFSINASFLPERDSIRLGDTLYLTSSIPIQLRDVTSGDLVNYQNAKIAGNLGIGKLSSGVKTPIEAVDQFKYVSVQGQIYNDLSIPSPKGVQQTLYSQKANTYELTVGLIPLNEGVYVLGVGFPVGIRGGHDCEKAGFSLKVTNGNRHLDFYEKVTGQPSNGIDYGNGYYFKVVPR